MPVPNESDMSGTNSVRRGCQGSAKSVGRRKDSTAFDEPRGHSCGWSWSSRLDPARPVGTSGRTPCMVGNELHVKNAMTVSWAADFLPVRSRVERHHGVSNCHVRGLEVVMRYVVAWMLECPSA